MYEERGIFSDVDSNTSYLDPDPSLFTYCGYIRCNFYEKKKCEEEKNCKFSFLSKNLFIKDTGTKKRHIKKGLN